MFLMVKSPNTEIQRKYFDIVVIEKKICGPAKVDIMHVHS